MNVDVWAPRAGSVRVRVAEPGEIDVPGAWTSPLAPLGGGWFGGEVEEARPGRDYGFLLDGDDTPLPDPRSRRQPAGLDGPSRFVDPWFPWTDHGWRGVDLPGAVFYELHVGTFTPEGTFAAAVDRLDHLVALGVTHVELLPVHAVDGVWNWGYDGVLWSAVHEPYGGPDGLKGLVDACHARGLAVTLDVVYNHVGPGGDVLARYGPYLKTGRNTWGESVNLDGGGSGPVRRTIIDNALMWLSEFHVDALRLDAVHALEDSSDVHLLAELSERVAGLAVREDRPLLLVAESDLNDPAMVLPRSEGGMGMDAQWDDDVHHALHALLTGERQGYYADFGSLDVLSTVLRRAFWHDGRYSTFRGRVHGRPVPRDRVPGYRFVAALQNHDQVGNRAAGDRLAALVSPGRAKVGAVLLLTSPFTPLLWMGEEWAATTPWPFFTSHPDPEVGAATTRGRLQEFADHGWDPAEVPDPQDPATYRSARLDWAEVGGADHADMLELYRRLLRARARYPDLRDPWLAEVVVDVDEAAGTVVVHRGLFRVVANLGPDRREVAFGGPVEVVVSTDGRCRVHGASVVLPPDSAMVVRPVDAGAPPA